MSKNIAILGATSHIAKGLIFEFSKQKEEYKLILFVRNKEKLFKFLLEYNINVNLDILGFDDFNNHNYDVIINCVGVGTPTGYNSLEENILSLNEKYDNMVLNYLTLKKNTLYIYMSSGAVYGTEYEKPIDEDTVFPICVSKIGEKEYYAISKIYTETKHRALNYLNIVDLRIFSYFSRFVDLNANYLITEMVKAVKEKRIFKTNSVNITRDFITSEDLFNIIEKCMLKDKINCFFDVYSKSPVTKIELIDFFKKNFNMKVEYTDGKNILNVTGTKSLYYSTNRKASKIVDYTPIGTSIENIRKELIFLLKKHNE